MPRLLSASLLACLTTAPSRILCRYALSLGICVGQATQIGFA